MAPDINGYNAAFKAFTDFAQQKMDAGETKAVARGEVQNKVFDGRVIKAATTDKSYAFTRSADEKYFNEVAREQFKRAIIDMFGGESNIPENVRKAMLLHIQKGLTLLPFAATSRRKAMKVSDSTTRKRPTSSSSSRRLWAAGPRRRRRSPA